MQTGCSQTTLKKEAGRYYMVVTQSKNFHFLSTFKTPMTDIRYSQYHIWDIHICVRPKKSFLQEKQPNSYFPWTRDSKCQDSADSLDKNTPIATKFISPICLSKPISLGHIENKASSGVHSPWFIRQKNFNLGRQVVKKMPKTCQRSLQTPPNANGRNASLEIIFT